MVGSHQKDQGIPTLTDNDQAVITLYPFINLLPGGVSPAFPICNCCQSHITSKVSSPTYAQMHQLILNKTPESSELLLCRHFLQTFCMTDTLGPSLPLSWGVSIACLLFPGFHFFLVFLCQWCTFSNMITNFFKTC